MVDTPTSTRRLERAAEEVERPVASPLPRPAPARRKKQTGLTDQELAEVHVRSRRGIVRTVEQQQAYDAEMDALATTSPARRHRPEDPRRYDHGKASAISHRRATSRNPLLDQPNGQL